MKTKLLTLLLTTCSLNAFGFDLEDYATTYRATRDAYKKAQNELALSKDAMDDYNAYLAANCLKVWDDAHYDFPNLGNLISGSCNRDGEASYVNGGVMPKSSKTKIGDILLGVIDRTPVQVVSSKVVPLEPGSPIWMIGYITNNMLGNRVKEIDSANVRVERIASGCTKTSTAVDSYITARAKNLSPDPENIDPAVKASVEAGHLEDIAVTFKDKRSAMLKAAVELKLATGPFFSARDAYHAATSTYTMNLDCDSGLGITATDRVLRDPYVNKDIQY